MSETWKGGARVDGRRFGARAERWFADVVRHALRTSEEYTGGEWDDAQLAMMAEWYRARVEDFVQWVPHTTIGASWGAHGVWEFNAKKFQQRTGDAVNYCAVITAGQRYPTLDAWLVAEQRGEIPATHERGGTRRLSMALRDQLFVSAQHRRGEIECCDCELWFRPERRTIKRCATCRVQIRKDLIARAPIAPAPLTEEAMHHTAQAFAAQVRQQTEHLKSLRQMIEGIAKDGPRT